MTTSTVALVPRYLSQSPEFQNMSLAPAALVTVNKTWPLATKRLAAVYNRLGGLLTVVADVVAAEPAAALAVWYVESSGREHVTGQAIIRFENHIFFNFWGQQNETAYATHFRHGGFQGTPGKRFQNHAFRQDPSAEFEPVHTGRQESEYRALALARTLAGPDRAVQAISIGGCQIMVFNYGYLGYTSATDMYNAFQASEFAHVVGFFDFCSHAAPNAKLLADLSAKNWNDFARIFNGTGQVADYAKRLASAYRAVSVLHLG